MSKEKRFHWLMNWGASRLHAVNGDVELPSGISSTQSLCGTWVYGAAPTEWARKKEEAGIAKCKRCERMVGGLG